MSLRKSIYALMAAVMLLMQLALANHFCVHFQEEEYTKIFSPDAKAQAVHGSHGQDKPDNGDDDDEKYCPFGKIFNQAFVARATPVAMPVAFTVHLATVFAARPTTRQAVVYRSRGPPSFLA